MPASRARPTGGQEPLEAWSSDGHEPAIAIDAATAEIIAANALAYDLLGINPAAPLPVVLDSAMPALTRLRELARTGASASSERLTFWSSGRLVRALCDISPLAQYGRPAAMIVRFAADTPLATDCDRANIEPPSAQIVEDHEAASPRIPRNDSQTLKEIARRIREGQRPQDQAWASPIAATEPARIDETPAAPSPDQTSQPSPWDQPRAAPIPLPPRDPARDIPAAEIAKLAHELKSPLTAIAAAAEIMRDQRLGAMGNEKYLGYASDIHESAQHALSVIGSMLSGSSGGQTDQQALEWVDLNEVASQVVSSMQPIAAKRRITLALDAEDGLPPVSAGATAIRQILFNLLSNACKFTPPDGDVRVVTGYLDNGARFLVVRDTGTGMDGEALAYALDEREPQPSHRAGGGSGLGLHLVRRLASEMAAEVEIDSAPGKGTVVLIAFR